MLLCSKQKIHLLKHSVYFLYPKTQQSFIKHTYNTHTQISTYLPQSAVAAEIKTHINSIVGGMFSK